MVTVELGRSEDEFWRMTPKRTGQLIREWSRLEELRGQSEASRIGYAVAMYSAGKVPKWTPPKQKETVIAVDDIMLL